MRFIWLYLLFSCFSCLAGKESAKHELTPEDVERFFDGFVPSQIEEANIANAVVAVVKDGKLVFTKGYGLSNPEKTLFRVGSISKLFVWTAVMQQVEQERLDLDRDINDYLDFKIPLAFAKPITLRDIMTHRSGFEESIKDVMVSSPKHIIPLSQYLRSHMPSRIFPPGVTPAYSNYATTLAAYIVERVSGQNFNDYVEEHIFKPLDMANSTFRQPLPEHLVTSMSNGYSLGSDNPRPFELLQIAPAGSLSTSAVDMTHFMIMHLQNGRYGNRQILKSDTVAQMHARQQGWPDGMNAMCLGFYEQSRNGYRIIGHEGNTVLFHSNLFLVLEANTGLFISYNSAGQSILDPRNVLFDKFMDRYFPETSFQKPCTPTSELQSITGTYEPSRRSETTFLRLSKLFQEIKVEANLKDNTIAVLGISRKPIHFREIAPMVFGEVGGKGKIAFTKDDRGRLLAHLNYNTHYPSVVFQHVTTILDKQNFNYFVLGFSLPVIVLTLLTWPFIKKNEKRMRIVTYLTCLTIVIYAIGLSIFASLLSDFSMLSKRSDLGLRALQVVALIGTLGSLGVIYYWFKCWKNLWQLFLALACTGFVWFIYHWNLLDFGLNY